MLRPTTTSSASSPSPSSQARLTSGSIGAWWTIWVRKRPSTTAAADAKAPAASPLMIGWL